MENFRHYYRFHLQGTPRGGIIYSALEIDPIRNRLYLTDINSDSLYVIDSSTDRVMSNVNVGRSPLDVAVDPDGNKIYVLNERSKSVSVIIGSTNNIKTLLTIFSKHR